MNYNETIEFEKNLKIKNEADKIYKEFLEFVILKVGNMEEDKFIDWKDQYNKTYYIVNKNCMTFCCRFLHERYDVHITPENIFEYIKNDYRGLNHFVSSIDLHKRRSNKNI